MWTDEVKKYSRRRKGRIFNDISGWRKKKDNGKVDKDAGYKWQM